MKLKYYGYKETKVEKRAMSMAELKLAIITKYIEHGESIVKLMDISYGDVVTFRTIEDVTKNNWSDSCKIELIGLPHTWNISDDRKESIIIFQVAEDLETMTIK